MASTRRYRLDVTQAARADIAAIVRWSWRSFGEAASLRYEALAKQALDDLKTDPDCIGAQTQVTPGGSFRTYHLKFSRKNVVGIDAVQRPRHYFVYRIKDDLVEILRLIHAAQDLERHLPSEET